jgi:valyl-tRNA synthetase
MPLGSLIDLGAEMARLEKENGKLAAEMEKIDKKLSNEKFVANAKPEVVEADRARFAELQEAQSKIAVAQQRLKDAE